MRLAIIPARGGSKRIPRKNIKIFAGQPMIAWSIRTAIKSQCFDRIIVSTDDEEIAEVARLHGAEVPFMRPNELSDDHTGTIPVVAHAVQWQSAQSIPASQVCCIYPTAPFMLASDLQRSLEVLENTGVDYVFSITSFPYPPQRAIRITHDHRVQMIHPECLNSRSQDLEQHWHDAGMFYWGKAEAWLNHTPLFSSHAAPMCLPRFRVHDIDTDQDWQEAEFLFDYISKRVE